MPLSVSRNSPRIKSFKAKRPLKGVNRGRALNSRADLSRKCHYMRCSTKKVKWRKKRRGSNLKKENFKCSKTKSRNALSHRDLMRALEAKEGSLVLAVKQKSKMDTIAMSKERVLSLDSLDQVTKKLAVSDRRRNSTMTWWSSNSTRKSS